MRVFYAGETLPSEVTATVFIAGPLPRAGLTHQEAAMWHADLIDALRVAGFTGDVFTPQRRDGGMPPSYDDQKNWELAALARADVNAFWLTRTEHVKAATTNTELGLQIHFGPQRIALGIPSDPALSLQTGYQRALAADYGIEVASNFTEMAQQIVARVGSGVRRVGGEALVPLYLWRTPSFRDYYNAQVAAGNRLLALTVVETPHRNRKEALDHWVVEASWMNAREGQAMPMQRVVGASSTCSIVAMYRHRDGVIDVVLIERFLPSAMASTSACIVAPGESLSVLAATSEVAAEAFYEQTGLSIAESRLKPLPTKQQSTQISAATVQAFALLLTEDEVAAIRDEHIELPEGADGSSVHVIRLQRVLEASDVDYATLGLLMTAQQALNL